MATVFLALDLKHRRRVAIKVLDPEVAAVVGSERFLREIEISARLTHPHILPLLDSGAAAGLLFYVMPYVEGESLRQRLEREKQLPLDDALEIVREVADALDHAHRQGVFHRDVKPENILLEAGHAVVADFGIARAVATADRKKLTTSGVVVGTPAYMSPEQAAGSRDLGGRSDQYSLGCVLYEMLAGQPPFTGPTVESLVHQQLNLEPRPVSALRSSVPPTTERALARALAKTPADRFATTQEFAAALGQGGEAAVPAKPVAAAEPYADAGLGKPGTRRTRRLPQTIAIVAVAAVAVWSGWGPLTHRLGAGKADPPARKDWILVAEFDGPTDEPSLARAARELVSGAIDQSAAMATVPRDQIRVALEQAGKPGTLRLTPELAREIAYRTTVRAVLEGEVARLGDQYTVTLRVTDVEENKQLAALADVARSEDDLIPVLTRMGRRVAEQLGKRLGAIPTMRGGEWAVATPSFEAYRRWSEGLRMYNEGDNVGALELTREAVTLDPGFGVAWASLGYDYLALGKLDSALFAVEEASRHRQSMTPAYRLYNDARILWWRGDAQGALEGFERVMRLYPNTVEAGFVGNNASLILEAQGRLQEALESEDRGTSESPLAGGGTLGIVNRVKFLIALGRLGEARTAAESLRGGTRQMAEMNLALAGEDWNRADSLANAYERAAPAGVASLVLSAVTRAQVAAVRGEVSAAEAHLRRAEALQHERGNPALAPRTPRYRVTLDVLSGRALPRPEPWLERDTTTTALITRAYTAAASGETTLARRLLTRLRARPTTRLRAHGSTPEFIEAWIAARAGRWHEVVGRIAQPAREASDRGGVGPDPIRDRIGTPAERWLVAQAYERLGQPDSAAAFYLRMLAPEHPEASLIGLVHPFVHQRLVLLDARMGRLEDAERHLAILERDLTRPDPDVRHLLDDARAAVRGARGVAAPQAFRR